MVAILSETRPTTEPNFPECYCWDMGFGASGIRIHMCLCSPGTAKIRFKSPKVIVIIIPKRTTIVHGAASTSCRLIVPQESPATSCWNKVSPA